MAFLGMKLNISNNFNVREIGKSLLEHRQTSDTEFRIKYIMMRVGVRARGLGG